MCAGQRAEPVLPFISPCQLRPRFARSDWKTGDSLCYGFIGFDSEEACEQAYFKMNNVLIDDRRIKARPPASLLGPLRRTIDRLPAGLGCVLPAGAELPQRKEEALLMATTGFNLGAPRARPCRWTSARVCTTCGASSGGLGARATRTWGRRRRAMSGSSQVGSCLPFTALWLSMV